MPISTMPPPGLGYYGDAYTERLAVIKAGYRETLARGGYPGAPVTEAELDVLAKEACSWQPEFQGMARGQGQAQGRFADVSIEDDDVGEYGLTEPFTPCLCHPMSSIAFPCPYSLPNASFPSTLSPIQPSNANSNPIRESERIASMSLNRIWEQPTPSRNPIRAPFDYVNPTPPLIPAQAHHAQLMEPVPLRAFYADGSYPAQTLADVRPDVIDGHLYDLNHRYIPRTWPNHEYGAVYEAIHIRAPHLSHRTVDHDMAVRAPYAGPRVYSAPVTTAIASPKRAYTLTESLATWYAQQVAYVLIDPGMFRPGANGASEDIWGAAGRERDGWDRVGLPIPHYSHRYAPKPPVRRETAYEAYDPYNLLWKNSPRVNDRLVSFVSNLIQRMTIAPSAVVSAVWYLHGLGLHDGDGEKGAAIRRLLRKEVGSEDDGVEQRVALLGLLLSGKWLDDNAFLTSSWSEVSLIPKKDIEQLEFAALGDLHHSLHIPISSWTDFVNLRWTELDLSDGSHAVLYPLLDQMVSDARANEIWEPVKPLSARLPVDVEYYDYVDRRLEEMYYADEQAGEGYEPRVQGSRGSTPVSQWSFPQGPLPGRAEEAEADEVMEDEDAARNVSALVDDEEMEADYRACEEMDDRRVFEEEAEGADESEDESEDEFLDYDGAARFLPTISELRRSASNSSAHSDMITEWRAGLAVDEAAILAGPPPIYHDPSLSPTLSPSPYDRPRPLPCAITSNWHESHDGHRTRVSSSEARCEPYDHDTYPSLGRRVQASVSAPLPNPNPIPAQIRKNPSSLPIPTATPQCPPKFNPTGIYLEPGIAQVRPSRYARQPLDTLFGVENQDPREAAVMAVLNPTGFTVRSRWD